MDKKVKVSREVAKALNDVLAYNNPAYIVVTSARNGWEERGVKNVGCLNERHLDLDTLIKAVYFGYEVEQTAEEEIAEVYQEAKQNFRLKKSKSNSAFNEGICDGIITTLDLLNIKIEGVNE